MRQKWRDPDGHLVDVGDREDVAVLLGYDRQWGRTFANYVRKRIPVTNPPPLPVSVDRKTRRDLFILSECRAWEFRRQGPGVRVKT
jgi:hypothetical protein